MAGAVPAETAGTDGDEDAGAATEADAAGAGDVTFEPKPVIGLLPGNAVKMPLTCS